MGCSSSTQSSSANTVSLQMDNVMDANRTEQGSADDCKHTSAVVVLEATSKCSSEAGSDSTAPPKVPEGLPAASGENTSELPSVPEADRRFFDSCPAGARVDFNGEAGFRFRALAGLSVTSLCRAAPEGQLREEARVTLWAAKSREVLASVVVGSQSLCRGGWALEPLSAAVELQAGKEYRLTQKCAAGMADPWFDGSFSAQELAELPAQQYLAFLGGVYSGCFGYPDSCDGAGRRAGMLNLEFTVCEENLVDVMHPKVLAPLELSVGNLVSEVEAPTMDLVKENRLLPPPKPMISVRSRPGRPLGSRATICC